MEMLFLICNALVIPGWIALVFFPNTTFTKKTLYSLAYPFALAIVYTVLIGIGSYQNFGGAGGMQSLEALRIAFTNDLVLTGAWVHYLVFDLFVAIWITKEITKLNGGLITRILFLLPTLFFGPFGFALFIIYRWRKLKS